MNVIIFTAVFIKYNPCEMHSQLFGNSQEFLRIPNYSQVQKLVLRIRTVEFLGSPRYSQEFSTMERSCLTPGKSCEILRMLKYSQLWNTNKYLGRFENS